MNRSHDSQDSIRHAVDQLIEDGLASHMAAIGTTETSLMKVGEVVEQFYKIEVMSAKRFKPALEILSAKILENIGSSKNETKSSIETIIQACDFAGRYYFLRDLIYYSYASESSIQWNRHENVITIKVIDPTIFRQYMVEHHAWLTASVESIAPVEVLSFEQLVEVLKRLPHGELVGEVGTKINTCIENEVDWKISHLYSGLALESQVDIGGYSYNEFIAVYRFVLGSSLYERAYSMANDLSCVISYSNDELVGPIFDQTGIDKSKSLKILHDIATCSEGALNHLQNENKFLLFPFTFSLRDGISDMLKQFARSDHEGFSSRCANVIGNTLLTEIENSFLQYKNFRIAREVDLQDFGRELPDIDLLIISYEPSLGFHVYVCEAKNTLYASWAKEYLKAKGKKGFVEKAIQQVNKVGEFLNSDVGANFLFDHIQTLFSDLDIKALFPTGDFLVLVEKLIVTSQNIGMFYPDEKVSIINIQMLKLFVRKSDGDVTYIQHCLHSLNEMLDKSTERATEEVSIDGVLIRYDVASLKVLFKIEHNEYLRKNIDKEIEQEWLRTGQRFPSEMD